LFCFVSGDSRQCGPVGRTGARAERRRSGTERTDKKIGNFFACLFCFKEKKLKLFFFLPCEVAAAADALKNKDSEEAQQRLHDLMNTAKKQAEELEKQQARENERRKQLLKVKEDGWGRDDGDDDDDDDDDDDEMLIGWLID
jgi:tRNA A37 methylthiotransferase MiaB